MNSTNTMAFLCRCIAQLSEHAPVSSQRTIAQALGISLGRTNQVIAELNKQGYLENSDGCYTLTEAGWQFLNKYKVDNAIILAAGFGSRFVPLTYTAPKGLLKVKETPMIERQIEQLKACGIEEIIIVVGYMKEAFDYLIDKYGVKLIYNPEYATKNNFASLYRALDYLKRSYILHADFWIEQSIFNTWEIDSWYCCTYQEGETDEWAVKTDTKGRITEITIGGKDAWAIVGPAFFSGSFSSIFGELTRKHYKTPGTENDYWEHILINNLKTLPPMFINRQSKENVYEFESLEQLRLYDEDYFKNNNNECLEAITRVFGVSQNEIRAIRPLKDGMTNMSFVFEVHGEPFVFRQPGVGTHMLINRQMEKRNYELVAPLKLTDEIIYFDGDSGVKISKYYEGARVSNPEDDNEVQKLMQLLKSIHDAGIKTEHRFDIAERINFYEGLAKELDAILFSDYEEVRKKANELLAFRQALGIPEVLCHIDYIFANVLHLPNKEIRVIDWEYSGAADPLIDIAMFSIYTYYKKEQMDVALRHYLGRNPTRREEARLYMYVALGGFLWSLWAEYKQGLGDEFGEYPLDMYRYMKDYYQLLKDGGYLDEQ